MVITNPFEHRFRAHIPDVAGQPRHRRPPASAGPLPPVQSPGPHATSPLTWVDEQTWQVTVPLDVGANPLTLVATDLHGDTVATDSIVVTRE